MEQQQVRVQGKPNPRKRYSSADVQELVDLVKPYFPILKDRYAYKDPTQAKIEIWREVAKAYNKTRPEADQKRPVTFQRYWNANAEKPGTWPYLALRELSNGTAIPNQIETSGGTYRKVIRTCFVKDPSRARNTEDEGLPPSPNGSNNNDTPPVEPLNLTTSRAREGVNTLHDSKQEVDDSGISEANIDETGAYDEEEIQAILSQAGYLGQVVGPPPSYGESINRNFIGNGGILYSQAYNAYRLAQGTAQFYQTLLPTTTIHPFVPGFNPNQPSIGLGENYAHNAEDIRRCKSKDVAFMVPDPQQPGTSRESYGQHSAAHSSLNVNSAGTPLLQLANMTQRTAAYYRSLDDARMRMEMVGPGGQFMVDPPTPSTRPAQQVNAIRKKWAGSSGHQAM